MLKRLSCKKFKFSLLHVLNNLVFKFLKTSEALKGRGTGCRIGTFQKALFIFYEDISKVILT